LLALRDVRVGFDGVVALDGVSLDVAVGEVLGIIGPNGAGKTTLLNAICGLLPTAAGTVEFDGGSLDRLPTARRARLGIARTLQGLGLFAHQTVLDNVRVGAQVHSRAGFVAAVLGLPASDADEAALERRARAALGRVGIDHLADRLPTTLPYPEQKKVALARALAAAPRLLLLDEPASGLGADDIDDLARLLADLRREVTVVLVEHHLDLVMAVCDRVAVLDFGRLIAVGPPEAVRADPAVLDAYLGRPVGG
jgi:branched-chain amino acid transport system ATP-binding protein